MVRNYLTDRIQRVTIPGGSPDWASVNSGVPQGSILGLLLFLLYINDKVHEINSSIRLFADDTSIYIIVDFRDIFNFRRSWRWLNTTRSVTYVEYYPICYIRI